jgi:curved DNA-binding protein CbpA
VTDYFALLDQPRRPWLDDAALRDAFHRRAAELHPDAPTGDGAAFAELNAAYATLRDPVPRLRHLLALEEPAALTRPTPIPADLSELFPVVGAARQVMVGFTTRRAAASSAVARALIAGEEAGVRSTATAARNALDASRERALEELRAIDAQWSAPEARAALAALHGRLAFLEKWDAQLREAALPLGGRL